MGSAYGHVLEPTDITGDSNHTAVTRFAGFSVRESAGSPAAAAVNFRRLNGSGQILWILELAANESAGIIFPGYMDAADGVYVEVVSGTISGEIFNLE